MLTYRRRTFVVGILALALGGCGRSDYTLAPGIMEETDHSHYHVHAVDASHGHAHADLDEYGGHSHPHAHKHSG